MDKKIGVEIAASLSPINVMGLNHLEELCTHASLEPLYKGQVLFQQGDMDQYQIYLISGAVSLEYASGRLEQLDAGQSRLPISPQQPRQCKAIAAEDSQILRIDNNRLNKLLSWSQIADYMAVDMAYDPNRDEDVDWVNTVLHSNLFYKVPPTNIGRLLGRMKPKVVEAGDVILRQGEIGDGCYFIKEGAARVTRADAANKPSKFVADIARGRCFGEDALIHETVRNATVIMTSPGVLMCMEKKDFIDLMKEPFVPEVSGDDLDKLIHQGAVLVDVRTEDEYNIGCLEGALNFPLHLMRNKQRLLDKQTHYIFYCDSGRLSRAATYLLGEQGFTISWLRAGLQNLSAPVIQAWFKSNGGCESQSAVHGFI